MIQKLVIWWASVPAFVRDLVEGALSAGAGAAFLAFQGINWADPVLTPRAIGLVIVTAFVGAFAASIRHHFTAPAAAITSGSVTTAPAIVAATPPPPAP